MGLNPGYLLKFFLLIVTCMKNEILLDKFFEPTGTIMAWITFLLFPNFAFDFKLTAASHERKYIFLYRIWPSPNFSDYHMN